MSAITQNLKPKFYSQKQVCLLTSLSRSTVERLERENKMPAPRRFGKRCKRYPSDMIDLFIEGKDWKSIQDAE